MSRRFGRNQKRKLRAQRDECVDLANRAHRRAEECRARAANAEGYLRDFVYEVEALLGDLRHSSLKPPELTTSETYPGRLELLHRARRERLRAFSDDSRFVSLGSLDAAYARVVLHELRAYGELASNQIGHHMVVEHGEHRAGYFLSDRALAMANPIVYDRMVADVAKRLVAYLIKVKRQSTAGLSGTTKEV